jgi:hypothetical protein
MNRQKRLLRATLGWRAAAKRVKAQRLAMCRLARRGARRRVVSTLRTMERVAAKRRALGHLVATREQKVAAKAVDALRATAERERLVEIGANRCAALEIRTRTRAARGTLSAWRSASRGRVRARTKLQRVVVCARRNALALCWSAWGRNVATSSAAARLFAGGAADWGELAGDVEAVLLALLQEDALPGPPLHSEAKRAVGVGQPKGDCVEHALRSLVDLVAWDSAQQRWDPSRLPAATLPAVVAFYTDATAQQEGFDRSVFPLFLRFSIGKCRNCPPFSVHFTKK